MTEGIKKFKPEDNVQRRDGSIAMYTYYITYYYTSIEVLNLSH